VKTLSAEVHQYRNAELKLQKVKSEKVVIVSPTILASSYFLTRHPLTAIEVESLPESVRASITDDGDIDLSRFKYSKSGGSRENPRTEASLSLK